MKLIFLLLLPQIIFAYPTKNQQFTSSLAAIIHNASMPDVYPGMVVASPSQQNPNYYFDWVRDTALTMRSLIDYYELKKDKEVKKMIFTWINAEKRRQDTLTLSGLGEPKYNVDGTGFSGPWGRPQNDGPALRAIAIIKFAQLLLTEGDTDYVLKNLYHGVLPADSVIKKDLEYIAHHWMEPSFDLWEEECGIHFYTLLTQYTALQEGAKLARELADYGAAKFYQDNSQKIADELQKFLDSKIGIKVTSTKVSALNYKKSGIDVAPLLALLHTYPYQQLFTFNHPSVKKYINTLINTFNDLYKINHVYPEFGVAIGRYPEDRYDGYATVSEGNPWFLATLALAEYYCLSNESFSKVEKQFNRVLFHSDHLGHLSEQFHHTTGFMQGAYQLTWSHNAFLTSMLRCHLVH